MSVSGNSRFRPDKMLGGSAGFTLIELMFVVLIISVMMVLAIPAYRGYITRAQMSEALSVASGVKATVAEICLRDGSCTNASSVNPEAGLANPDEYNGKYLQSITVISGRINMKMKKIDDGVNAAIAEKILVLKPADDSLTGSISWVCSTVSIPEQYLPSACRN